MKVGQKLDCEGGEAKLGLVVESGKEIEDEVEIAREVLQLEEFANQVSEGD